MKKLSIFLLGALAVAATSCEDGPSVTPVQSNPQGPVLEVDGVTGVQNPASAAVNLPALAAADENIPLADFSAAYLPEGYALKVVAEVSKDENFSKFANLPITYADGIASCTPTDLGEVYVANISKSPMAKDVYVRYATYAVKGNEELRIGGINDFIGPFVMNVTPFPSDLVIENNYYLVGQINGWNVATAVKFNHDGDNGYDNPVFSIVFDVTDVPDWGWMWKVLPESTVEAGNWVDASNSQYGVDKEMQEDLEGMLVASKLDEDGVYTQPEAGIIWEPGTYMMTINMEEGTYNIQLALPHLYIQGDAAGWNWDSPLVAEMQTTDYVNYYAYGRVSTGGYKFTSEKSWSALYNLGADGDLEFDGNNVSGVLKNGSNDNIFPKVTGLYWHHVNITTLAFDSYYIETLGLIGDATPQGWDASTALTPSEDGLVWEGDVEFKATGEFKVRANNAWAVNLGGDLNNLTQDGSNLATPGAGVKHVVLNLSAYPYTMTIN